MAVVVIIVQGMRIVTSGGGEAKGLAYKNRSSRSWFNDYRSLRFYKHKPALVQFNALKIKVVEGMPLSRLYGIWG